jgi:SOS-response transcriptional repressor LexA
MARREKQKTQPQWASRIMGLRRRLKISQSELAKRMNCSAMTVSRWERGLQPPSAEFYIQLGKLGGKDGSWFFWERAGLQMADVERALPKALPRLQAAHAGASARAIPLSDKKTVSLPVLKAFAGSHGERGDRRLSLERIPTTRVMGAPAEWCSNPRYTSMLYVKGHSMEPLIRNGDIIAVDSLQNDRAELDGKIVIATSEDTGLCISRFRRYETVDVLESQTARYPPVILNKSSSWRIVGRVLWWISPAP